VGTWRSLKAAYPMPVTAIDAKIRRVFEPVSKQQNSLAAVITIDMEKRT